MPPLALERPIGRLYRPAAGWPPSCPPQRALRPFVRLDLPPIEPRAAPPSRNRDGLVRLGRQPEPLSMSRRLHIAPLHSLLSAGLTAALALGAISHAPR